MMFFWDFSYSDKVILKNNNNQIVGVYAIDVYIGIGGAHRLESAHIDMFRG